MDIKVRLKGMINSVRKPNKVNLLSCSSTKSTLAIKMLRT